MAKRKTKNFSVVFVKDRLALDLLEKRVAEERRSGANAAETTIIEALSIRYGKKQDTKTQTECQGGGSQGSEGE